MKFAKIDMESRGSAGRISNLDVLRAVAAVAVCLVHFDRKPLFEGTFFHEWSEFGKYGVDIFFVISGFVIPLSLWKRKFQFGNFIIFLQARFFRLYPTYLAALVLTVGLWYLSFVVPGFRGTILPELTLSRILSNLTLTCGFTGEEWYAFVTWTLAVEAQFYVFLALCFPLLAGKSLPLRIGAATLWIVLPLFIRSGPTVFPWTALFAFGILEFMRQEQLLPRGIFIVLVLSAICIQLFVRDVAGVVAAVSTLLAIMFMPEIKWKPFIWIGTVSYSLYLLHAPIGGRVMNFLERYPEFPGMKILAIPIALGAALAASAVFYRFIELPSHEFARKKIPFTKKPRTI